MRKTLLVIALTAASGLAMAGAATADTTTTFTITTGGLAVSQPATASIGSGAPGGTISGSLGSVTVTDTRAALLGSWTATAVATAFTTGTGTAAETIPAADVSYWSGLPTAVTGLGLFTPGQATVANKVVIDTAKTAFSRDASAGNNSAAWNPTIVVAVPTDAVAGDYTGTVTHSVA